MYMAKRTGKRRSVYYRPGMEKENKRLGILAQSLSQAIKNRELSLHYQPIYKVDSDTIDSYEALIRWQCESLGYISADETIRIAEATGLIHSIENWVIRQALQDLKEFREGANNEVRMSINISGLHLAQSDFVSSLEEKILQANLVPQDVIIELTETALLEGIDDDDNHVNQLHRLGVSISIDDFGTGYSSLAYLHKIPADVVKIDKSFVEQVGKDSRTIDYIHRLISSLGKTTLVEGVETQEQKDIIQALGINLHQGYWFSRPHSLMFYKSQPKATKVIEIG
jgi:EAL domain-containing protein (putative c-di-GMP-specific phosphodiesterase class I)